MAQADRPEGKGTRCIAVVGPFQSGKTTLLEALLNRSGARSRQGSVTDGSTLGDASAEARAHNMSVELNAADLEFLDERFTLIDCPGSVEFQSDMRHALSVVDAAVVVCEPDEKKIPSLQLILKDLEDRNIPHMLFLNKIDKASGRVRDMLEQLQAASQRPLVLRQIPIWDDGAVTGFVDLALERAHLYREQESSEVIDIPSDLSDRESEARFSMLEQLADFDDALMEQLLEDIEPERDRIFADLTRELAEGHICPVLIGSAEHGNGILRLLKALRHEVPTARQTAERLGLDPSGSAVHVFKTLHTAHAGKLSLARVLTGALPDHASLVGENETVRPAGIFDVMGQDVTKRDSAEAGDTVALGRLDHIATGETLAVEGTGTPTALPEVELPQPVYGKAIEVSDRKEEVKMTGAVAKIIEEDPALTLRHDQAMHEMVLSGQGEMHLRVALERLERKFGIHAASRPSHVPYKETIRKPTTQRGRHKKQSGGHGQFGDVVLEISPQARGLGFAFSDRITGGVVPKQFIPSVESGVQDALLKGPLGFQVVDVSVCLTDGSYHSVDSSDQAFKMAGRLAINEGLPECAPVLLEPIMAVSISTPSEATAKINAIISSRRGQILGFDAREGWPGWDKVEAHMPASELHDLIIEIRSATAGVGTYTTQFDHLAELTGKAAEKVIASATQEAA